MLTKCISVCVSSKQNELSPKHIVTPLILSIFVTAALQCAALSCLQKAAEGQEDFSYTEAVLSRQGFLN